MYLELCTRLILGDDWEDTDGEVDFVSAEANDRLYVQVTQEINPRRQKSVNMNDCWKSVITIRSMFLRTDEFAVEAITRNKSMHIADFLLSTEY